MENQSSLPIRHYASLPVNKQRSELLLVVGVIAIFFGVLDDPLFLCGKKKLIQSPKIVWSVRLGGGFSEILLMESTRLLSVALFASEEPLFGVHQWRARVRNWDLALAQQKPLLRSVKAA